MGVWTSGQNRRFRLSRHSRNGREVKGDRRGVLRRQAQAFLLRQLLDWRASGPDGSTAIPADYDGLIAGAPSNNFTRVTASFIWGLQVTEIDPASYIPANKYPAIEAAALAACDARDGVKDGVI